ncbi:MAG: 30S ribosomal protein S3, partial [Pseudomonadota bacterium]|nr:30S ribosomal protein S3 [Pseudomonadota bacterium]
PPRGPGGAPGGRGGRPGGGGGFDRGAPRTDRPAEAGAGAAPVAAPTGDAPKGPAVKRVRKAAAPDAPSSAPDAKGE